MHLRAVFHGTGIVGLRFENLLFFPIISRLWLTRDALPRIFNVQLRMEKMKKEKKQRKKKL